MDLANSQEEMSRGRMFVLFFFFFQYGFKAVMEGGVEIFRNP